MLFENNGRHLSHELSGREEHGRAIAEGMLKSEKWQRMIQKWKEPENFYSN
jgi:hypothetical protein